MQNPSLTHVIAQQAHPHVYGMQMLRASRKKLRQTQTLIITNHAYSLRHWPHHAAGRPRHMHTHFGNGSPGSNTNLRGAAESAKSRRHASANTVCPSYQCQVNISKHCGYIATATQCLGMQCLADHDVACSSGIVVAMCSAWRDVCGASCLVASHLPANLHLSLVVPLTLR